MIRRDPADSVSDSLKERLPVLSLRLVEMRREVAHHRRDNTLEEILFPVHVVVEGHRLHAEFLREGPHRQTLWPRPINLDQRRLDDEFAAEFRGCRRSPIRFRAFCQAVSLLPPCVVSVDSGSWKPSRIDS